MVASRDDGPPKDRGLTSMKPIAADPHQRGALQAGHISDGVRAKLADHPAQAPHIHAVAGR